VIGDNIPNENHEGDCPKCKGKLEFLSGCDMENETWQCLDCHADFDVRVDLVRDWSTLEELKQEKKFAIQQRDNFVNMMKIKRR